MIWIRALMSVCGQARPIPPGFFSKPGSSADLAAGLCEHLGVDLHAPMLRNPDQAAQDYPSMVLRCPSCTDQLDCADRQARSDHFDTAPDYCKNKDIFDRQT